MASDDDLFRQEMADVTPIKPDNRVQERAPRREPLSVNNYAVPPPWTTAKTTIR